jgi:CII-binding regulator of phage lambda lysogenization HflD
LRAHPAPDLAAVNASHQVAELTLALRSLSDKLTATELALVARTTELATALNDIRKQRYEVERAKEEASRQRGIKIQHEEREREMERRIQAAEQERNMTDLVVQEYADLVRTLEGRQRSPSHSRTSSNASGSGTVSESLVNGLASNRQGLQKLLSEFSASSQALEAEISRLHGELESLAAQRDAEQRATADERAQAAQVTVELERLRVDDNTSAKMVSRYMYVNCLLGERVLLT